jgi:hypothetical protein
MTEALVPELTDEEWAAEQKAAFAAYKAAQLPNGNLLLDDGSESGIREEVTYDTADERVVIKRVEDVEPVLDWCKGRYNEGLVNRHSEFRHVGRYPVNVLNIFAKKWGFPDYGACLKDKEMMNRLINDSDLAYFRTLPGRY